MEGWEKGSRGKIFREISGNPQTARSDKDLLRPKLETATHSGAITYPPSSPLLTPICVDLWDFINKRYLVYRCKLNW